MVTDPILVFHYVIQVFIIVCSYAKCAEFPLALIVYLFWRFSLALALVRKSFLARALFGAPGAGPRVHLGI